LIALDTNILVYAASAGDDSGKHNATLELFDRLAAIGAIVALPVIGELFNARRKKKFAELVVLLADVETWMDAFDCAPAQLEDYLKASALSERFNLQYFDALIITVAARAGATMLLSEDMHDGLDVDGLRVVNPFVAGNARVLADYFAAAV
jgi:predicted nucleic acid-binding protein